MKIKKVFLLSLVMFLGIASAQATHNRAGEILYKLVSPLTYEVTIVTYTKTSGSSSAADRDSLEIFWGDGSSDLLLRVNGPDASPSNGVPDGVVIADDIKKNEYKGVHQYAGALPFYVINVLDPNRIDNIVNIDDGNSINIAFYIEDTLRFCDIPSFGLNSSPELLNPPIDYANVNDTFYHNPNAWDAEGDSLHFELIRPKRLSGTPVPNYRFPNQVIPGPNNQFAINEQTGELIWATPQLKGVYNIAILITEYRNGKNLGNIIRDMQIIVEDLPNDPPVVEDVRDTCVIAGEVLNALVNAYDPDSSQIVTLTAAGGPFEVSSPATFPTTMGNPTSSVFDWQTQCSHIRSQPYTVVFKAEDDFTTIIDGRVEPRPLVDLETWQITVVAPAPDSLKAEVDGKEILLDWLDPYDCASYTNFRGFSVWRRIGSNPFTPDRCETGLAGRGYTQITDRIMDYNYTDADVNAGHLYCYRILAHFSKLSPNGNFESDVTVSIPSNEACAELRHDFPVMTHVSVLETDVATGRIYVEWSKPKTDTMGLDTIANPGPYTYELFRKEGYPNSASTYTLVTTFTSPTFNSFNDTTFTDVGLNTEDNPYTYKVNFTVNGGTDLCESSEASSVYLNIGTSDRTLILSWDEQVPWINTEYDVFKLNPITSVYDSIATVTEQMYIDTGLINDSLYCYYVRSRGAYTQPGYVSPIINLSQEKCARPTDTVPPCPPIVEVMNDCETIPNETWDDGNFVNELIWNIPPASCGVDISKYFVYYQAPNSSDFVFIDSTTDISDTTFTHNILNSEFGLAGCYGVTAIDVARNESNFGNTVCVDNCPQYNLPNVFTPNGDGANELFTPFLPYRFVSRIEMKIFDRSGNLVYETENPDILWDGTDMKSGRRVAEGVYFYSGFYYEQRLEGEVKKPLPTNGNGGGFIHLMRDK